MTMSSDKVKAIHVDPNQMEWEPLHNIAPAVPEPDGEYGFWVKVMRRPDADGNGCWCYILHVKPKPGVRMHLKARAASDEEGFSLTSAKFDADGHVTALPLYRCHPEGLLHGAVAAGGTEDRYELMHFHGALDEVLGYEERPVEASDTTGIYPPTEA